MSSPAITELLARWRSGDRAAEAQLVAEVYPLLREMARGHVRRSAALTLSPTEVVHEAYARLAAQHGVDWKNREHFLAIAATVMRRVVIDYVRTRQAEKRGGDVVFVGLDAIGEQHPASADGSDWLAVDQALDELAGADPRSARVVELRLFGGLSVEEIAQVCESSVATVGRQWRFARAWLAERVGSGHAP